MSILSNSPNHPSSTAHFPPIFKCAYAHEFLVDDDAIVPNAGHQVPTMTMRSRRAKGQSKENRTRTLGHVAGSKTRGSSETAHVARKCTGMMSKTVAGPSKRTRALSDKTDAIQQQQQQQQQQSDRSQTSHSSKATSGVSVKTTKIVKKRKYEGIVGHFAELGKASPFTKEIQAQILCSSSDVSTQSAKKPGRLSLKQVNAFIDLQPNIRTSFRMCDSASSQFKLLEKEGILKAFSMLKPALEIDVIDFKPSYAPTINHIGLFRPPSWPSSHCTETLYRSFHTVRHLDFSQVPIVDDDSRYLIKLPCLNILNLQNTKITDKTIRHLAHHAAFLPSLTHLILANNNAISDHALRFLSAFEALKHLDLFGTTCTLMGLRNHLIDHKGMVLTDIRHLRLPEAVASFLDIQHSRYTVAMRRYAFSQDEDDAMNMELVQVKQQLKYHKAIYPSANIFLNLEEEQLRQKLMDIIKWRKKEECLRTLST